MGIRDIGEVHAGIGSARDSACCDDDRGAGDERDGRVVG